MFSYASRAAAALGIMCAHAMFAAPALTTIQDILYRADGARYEGTITITWNGFQTGDGSSIATQGKTLQITNGVLRVQLAPTANWAGASYTVRYNSQGMYQFTETWAVPSSTTPLRIKDVRVGSGTVVGPPPVIGEIGVSDVTGLSNELALRPSKGSGYLSSRAAVIDATGNLAAAAGNAADCVRVDGTSGPCGSATGLVTSFADEETPSGVVNGANDTFRLNFLASPASSLLLFRNGLRLTESVDYSLSGDSIRFLPDAIPQGGDILTASYRYADPTSPVGTLAPTQVICSGFGSVTNATSATEIGSCTVPAGVLHAGDRVEIRFDYAREGGTSPFSIQIVWGGSTVLSRGGTADDQMLTGHVDLGCYDGGAQWSAISWGSSTASLVASSGVAPDTYTAAFRISLRAQLSAPTSTDMVRLRSFTVIRYPAQIRP